VFGLALAPSFLRAICSIPSFGKAKFAVDIWSPDTNKNANKTHSCRELLRVFSMPTKNSLKIRNGTDTVSYYYC
jgi:hypothetical protein